MIRKILAVSIGAFLLAGCCAKLHYPPVVFMPPTQQEQRIRILQEEMLRQEQKVGELQEEKLKKELGH